MLIKTQEVKRLIESLADKTGQALDYSGFGMMSYLLEDAGQAGISQRYLYQNIWRGSIKALAEGRELIKPSLHKLNQIAGFLGYKNFFEFQTSKTNSLDPRLMGFLGKWESYARNNSGKAQILVSPVQFILEEEEVWMELSGPVRTLRGKVELKASCLCCLISTEDKNLYLVFKLGQSLSPRVLQGVFSGISTAGEPIAGREVLVRIDDEQSYTTKNRIIYLNKEESVAREYEEVISYFHSFDRNYLKIRPASSFRLDDLMD